MTKILKATILILLSVFVLCSPIVYGQTSEESKLYDNANESFRNGQYKEAIAIYDNILERIPENQATLRMKGIAHSNLGNHEESLRQFFMVLQFQPNDVVALTGMGAGFGNLGEYHEAKNYFDKALKQDPESRVIQNYKEFTEGVISKYPYTATEKPEKIYENSLNSIPQWVKPVAKWWSEDKIKDAEFVKALQFLLEKEIIQIQLIPKSTQTASTIPLWIKDNAGWWAEDKINDHDFVSGIQYMIESGIIKIEIPKSNEEMYREKQREWFDRYLRNISKNISDEKRYIEYANPSADVIKKFLRDYIKWNFEEEVKSASGKFPDPLYEVIDDAYLIHYKVFINDQPTGLPLDHVSTLQDSFAFWEEQELTINDKIARVDFEVIQNKHDANIWITWVVRDLGEGVLGHAHLGKGVVEVTLGDYSCDGSFQLYDVTSVKQIMTHELGHSIGLPHIEDPSNIMYPSMSPEYAYCLLS
ncbi:MAG: matrixin family metalloprotease [Nitrosopumilaceae archaeon]